jgi:hypothetical protein
MINYRIMSQELEGCGKRLLWLFKYTVLATEILHSRQGLLKVQIMQSMRLKNYFVTSNLSIQHYKFAAKQRKLTCYCNAGDKGER